MIAEVEVEEVIGARARHAVPLPTRPVPQPILPTAERVPTRYTPPMRIPRPLAVFCLVLATSAMSFAQPAPPPMLGQPDGVNVGWSDWLGAHGSTAVVIWASWLPEEQRDIKGLADIRRAAADKGLDFVVIAIQEPISASRDALGSSGLPWLHDRHGAMLKHLLIYRVPALAIVRKDGTVLARLQLDPQVLAKWSGSK